MSSAGPEDTHSAASLKRKHSSTAEGQSPASLLPSRASRTHVHWSTAVPGLANVHLANPPAQMKAFAQHQESEVQDVLRCQAEMLTSQCSHAFIKRCHDIFHAVQLPGRYLRYQAAQQLTKQPMRAPWLTWHGLMPGKR